MLSTKQLNDAIDYNDDRTYSTRLWQAIQREADAVPDGIPGPETARQVALWQLSAGIKADGMVGPQTIAAMRLDGMLDPTPEPNGCGKVETLGIWWDLGPEWSVNDRERFADVLAGWGVDVVALMGDRSVSTKDLVAKGVGNVPPRWRWTPEQAGAFAEALHARGIAVDIVTWPRPTRTYLDEHDRVLRELVDATDARLVQLDLEGNWRSKDYRRKHDLVVGFNDLHDAGRHLVASVRKTGRPFAVTTYFYHGEHRSHLTTVAPQADVLIPQAYATYEDDPDKASEWWGAVLERLGK